MRITKKCPVCGKWPQLKVWYVAIKGALVYQLQLICEDGMHIIATSYSEDIKKLRHDWNRIVEEQKLKMKGDN